ncbi:hypothetical protein PMAC_000806 [Pneumocystis sp. 'macacae']|nr:hypothetical protein PMAC_000806 [Pneumocystis sp. 'macacae']
MHESLDILLSLEDQCVRQQLSMLTVPARVEGRLAGIEAGYASFLPVGRVRGRCDVWRSTVCLQPASPGTPRARAAARAARLSGLLERTEQCLEALCAPAAHDAERFAILWRRLAARFRVLAGLLGEKTLLDELPAHDIEDQRLPAQPLL